MTTKLMLKRGATALSVLAGLSAAATFGTVANAAPTKSKMAPPGMAKSKAAKMRAAQRKAAKMKAAKMKGMKTRTHTSSMAKPGAMTKKHS